MNRKELFIVAILIDLIFLVVLAAMLGLVLVNLNGDEESTSEPSATPIIFATVIEIVVPADTPIPTLTSTPILTPTESPTLTPIPSPTRILPEEPTKSPYIFQTPVFIPPNMRDRSTPTPTRMR